MAQIIGVTHVPLLNTEGHIPQNTEHYMGLNNDATTLMSLNGTVMVVEV
jgi:hypothetical protein